MIYVVAPAVARAAMESGVAQLPIADWDAYADTLKKRLGLDDKFIRTITQKAKAAPKRVVFAEADNPKILKAATLAANDGIALPILLGEPDEIYRIAREGGYDVSAFPIINPLVGTDFTEDFANRLYEKRQRKGMVLPDAKKAMRDRNYYGAMMVETGQADALITGMTRSYSSVIKPALHIIGIRPDVIRVAGLYIMLTKKGPFFFADATVNINPSADELCDIAASTARFVKLFNIEPVMAMLSYSNFGSNTGEVPAKMAEAARLVKERYPDLTVDGDIQANFAANPSLLADVFPFTPLATKPANTFIFPDLASGNIAYKLLQSFDAAEAVGPVLLGMNKPVHILQLNSSVREIMDMIAIAVVDAQTQVHTQV